MEKDKASKHACPNCGSVVFERFELVCLTSSGGGWLGEPRRSFIKTAKSLGFKCLNCPAECNFEKTKSEVQLREITYIMLAESQMCVVKENCLYGKKAFNKGQIVYIEPELKGFLKTEKPKEYENVILKPKFGIQSFSFLRENLRFEN